MTIPPGLKPGPVLAAFMMQTFALSICGAQLELDSRVIEFEKRRIEVIRKASSATIAVFSTDGQGGGSGVLIDSSGYALTNFHVVDPCGIHLHCGTNDGKLHDAVLVGIDPVGDLALIKLLGNSPFPTATFANSDSVRVGQPCFTAGNPFLLAHDFRPSIAWGVISGTHRYQYPAGTLLEYTDCLQTDAAINPGNSGGPLFDADGQLIGINGRGSFEKRGRVNVGVGYAISANQARNFLGSLKSGRVLDHASVGFTVSTGADSSVRVNEISDTSSAFQNGLRYDDQILAIAGRKVETVNDVKNVIGIYPAFWSIPVVFRQDGEVREAMIDLQGIHTTESLLKKIGRNSEKPSDNKSDKALIPNAVKNVYQERRGFANHFFNRQETDRVLKSLRRRYHAQRPGTHTIILNGRTRLDDAIIVFDRTRSGIRIGDEAATILANEPFENQTLPRGSGGMLNGIHILLELLFASDQKLAVSYLGTAPWVSLQEKNVSRRWQERELYDVLQIVRDGTVSRLYVDRDGHAVAIKYLPFPESVPCVVEFSGVLANAQKTAGIPARMVGHYGGRVHADMVFRSVELRSSSNLEKEDRRK